MQIVVLAGGLATRLGEVSRELPKSLIPVGGKPFIAWQLEHWAASGFSDLVLCVGHLGEKLEAYLGDGSSFGLRARYSQDGPHLLGTGGALRRALPLLEKHFLLTYGDSYLPFDYAAPLRDLRNHPEALGTLSVFLNRDRWDRSNCQVTDQLVVRYEKGVSHPALDHIDYGAMALCRAALELKPDNVVWGLEALQAELAQQRRLRALPVSERFYEIGSPSGLKDFEAYLSSRGAK